MPTRLKEKAVERSTFGVIIGFYDTLKQPVTPNAVQWTLTDRYGTVINQRERVSLLDLAPEMEIVLSGADLQVVPTGVTRVLTVEGYYDSSLGQNLPVNDVCIFEVIDLLKVK